MRTPGRDEESGAPVGFVLGTYLSFTETFLYQQMRSLSRYRPVVLCGRLANEGRFPWTAPLYIAKKSPPRLLRALGPLHRFVRLDPGWRDAIVDHRIALLHGQFGTNGLVAAVYARRHRLPLVTSFYGGDVGYLLAPRQHLRDQWHYLLGKRALFSASSLVLVLSEAMRGDLVQLGCPPEKIRIQRNGVDLERFRPRSIDGDDMRQPVQVVMCGRETDKKGFDYAFRAVKKARDGGADLHVRWLTAPGPQGAALRALLRDLSLLPHVDELDPSTNPAPVMAGADIILCASVTAENGDKEGVPTVLVEAAACGLPAVASRHAGIPEIVSDGETGLLFAERDVDGLAAGLTRLAADASLRRRFGAAARRKVEEGWDANRLAARLEQLYDEARDLAPREATY